MLKQWSWLLAVGLAVLQMPVQAEEIVFPQRIVRTVHVNAPPATVWAKIGNFADMSWYPAAIAGTELTAGEAGVKGAKRRISLKSGGTLEETLTRYPEAGTSYTYTMDSGILPVRELASTIRVRPYEKGSEISWIGRFKRQDPADPAGDEKALAAVKTFYDAGLAAIVAQFGKKAPKPKSPARKLR